MVEYIIIIVISLLLSAYFSGMEIAYFSSNRLKVEIDRKQSSTYDSVAGYLMRSPSRYISTILVGNNIALVIYSTFMSLIVQHILNGKENFFLETIVSTTIVIFVAEYIPKAIVKANPNFYMTNFAFPIIPFMVLFYPLSKLTTALSHLILRMFGLKIEGEKQIVGFDKIDLASLVENNSDDPSETPTENEIKIFQNALDFSDLRVRDCMLPRVDIVAVEVNDSIEDVIKLFVRSQFSRIPVYEGTIDNIIGYVNSRRLFENPINIRQIMREPIFVPESGLVQKLLSKLIKDRMSIAIVIDEFGGTAGMVTIEDVLEEIFGEIEDEHDADYLVEKQVDSRTYIFSGRHEVNYLNETYSLSIPESEHYETLAGLILYTQENVPSVGEVVTIDGMNLKILRGTTSRISMIELKIR